MNKEKIMKSENPCPSVELYNADCMEIMKKYSDNYFDLAIVDPPYGIGVNKMTLGNGKKKIYRGINNWDDEIPDKKYFDELFRISNNQIIWGGNYMTEFLKPTSAWLFWDKGTGKNDFADGELAWTSFNGALRKFFKSWVGANAKNGKERLHPTEKPVALYEWLFKNYAKEGDKILDTHLGSGSIVIALDKMNKIEKMNLTLVGSELDEDYFKSACERIKEQTSQMTIFE